MFEAQFESRIGDWINTQNERDLVDSILNATDFESFRDSLHVLVVQIRGHGRSLQTMPAEKAVIARCRELSLAGLNVGHSTESLTKYLNDAQRFYVRTNEPIFIKHEPEKVEQHKVPTFEPMYYAAPPCAPPSRGFLEGAYVMQEAYRLMDQGMSFTQAYAQAGLASDLTMGLR